MGKKNKSSHDHGRGEIKHNALAALVTSKTFRSKVHISKIKTHYKRHDKHKKSPKSNDGFGDFSLNALFL